MIDQNRCRPKSNFVGSHRKPHILHAALPYGKVPGVAFAGRGLATRTLQFASSQHSFFSIRLGQLFRWLPYATGATATMPALPCHREALFATPEEAQVAINLFARPHGYAVVILRTINAKNGAQRPPLLVIVMALLESMGANQERQGAPTCPLVVVDVPCA